jgi:putative SOS response-associated peptidase YedK
VLPRSGPLVAFAGLFETWHGPDGSEIDTAVIVTTDANDLLRPIHDRMPVVLEQRDFAAWLSRATDPADAQALLKPAPESLFSLKPVSRRVNSADNDDPGLLEDLPEAPEKNDRERDEAERAPLQGRLF